VALAWAVALLLAAPVFSGGKLLAAQTPAAQASAPTQMKPASSADIAAAAQPSTQTALSFPAVTPQPPPDWPANDRPSEATVTWDSHGLRIVAANSSLAQILKDVATQTGATQEGLNKDERIFGVYGPGPARDVIGQLLDGSGYNVLLIGDLGQGTPRQIVLTARSTGNAQPGSVSHPGPASDEDTEVEQEAQQPEPPPVEQGSQPPAGMAAPPPGGVPMRSPQAIQELQQRQQQIQQAQQPNPQ
jgi:hypothetical protein